MSEVKTLAAFVRRAKGEMQCRYPAVDDEMCSVALDAVDEFEQEIGKLLPLDSPVLPLSCPTCGGDGQVNDETMEPGEWAHKPCPTCHGARRFAVVGAKARAEFEDEVGYQLELATSMDAIDDAHLRGALEGIATALLGQGWRVGECEPGSEVAILEPLTPLPEGE